MIEQWIERALPQPDRGQVPPFQDARSARDWLKLLPLINVPVAHAELTEAISQLNHSDLPALDALKIIEQFRETVHILQEGMQEKLIGKPVPLTPAEQETWFAIYSMWLHLEHAYALAWRAACSGEQTVAEYLPLLAERTLYYTNQAMACQVQIYRRPPARDWQQLFAFYQLARAQHIDKLKARDSLIQISGVSTPEAMFLHALLFAAANPYQYSHKQQLWLHKRLEILATRSTLAPKAEGLPGRQPLLINLAEPGVPLRADGRGEADELSIDTLSLAQVLSKRIKLLRMGEMPEKIGLGSELGPQAAEELLRELYRAWCDHPLERQLPRRPTDRYLEAGLQLKNLHLWLAAGHFAPPPQAEQQMSSAELMQIRMFGQTSARLAPVAPLAPQTQQWQISNETAQGMCLRRPRDETQRLVLHQVLMIADGQQRLIGQIRWLAEQDGEQQLGLQLLPGTPHAASIRAQDAARFGQSDFTSVVMIDAVPALKSPASLLLPPGWFRQGRLLDYWDGQTMHRIRLVSLLQRGADFERVHFVGSGGL